MKKIIYIHGKGGNISEAGHYKKFFPNAEVIGFDYKSENIFDAVAEFQKFFNQFDKATIIANSIGAFYAMYALSEKNIEKAFFISPIVDMENLILEIMARANVTEKILRDSKEIVTDFGEILSWEYLCYVRENPINWKIPTNILYGSKDFFTSLETMKNFAAKIGASLTVMQGGEHWFHTAEQMNFLDNWLESIVG